MKYIDIHTHREDSENQADILTLLNVEEYRSDAFVSMGIHPWHLEEGSLEKKIRNIESYIGKENFLAVGETGLDKLCKTDFSLQIECFSKMITLAEKYRKPLIIHCVKAYGEILKLLDNFSGGTIIHGFNKRFEVAKQLLERGFYLSFGKSLFDERSNSEKTLKNMPLDRIFLETDESEFTIREVYDRASQIKEIPLENLTLHIENNFIKVFNAKL